MKRKKENEGEGKSKSEGRQSCFICWHGSIAGREENGGTDVNMNCHISKLWHNINGFITPTCPRQQNVSLLS